MSVIDRFSAAVRVCARAVLTAVFAAALAAAPAACGGDDAARPAAPARVSIVYTARDADQSLPTVTERAGIFDRHGVDADVTFLPPAQAVAALADGRAQLGVLAAPAPQAAAVAGTPLRFVAQWQSAADLALVARPGVDGVRALKGRRIGVTTRGAASDLLAGLAVRDAGVPAKRVPVDDPRAAFVAGRVDAAVLTPGERAAAGRDLPGARVLRDFGEAPETWPLGLTGMDPWLRANRDTVVRVLRALAEGRAYFLSRPAEAQAAIAAEGGPAPGAQTAAAYASAKARTLGSLAPTMGPQQTVLALLAAVRPEAAGFPPGDLLDDSYAREAAD